MNNLCPCCANKTYNNCCEPIINHQSAATAHALMRSRYSSYKTNNTEYLINTTHSTTRNNHSQKDLKTWAEENTWNKLEVISIEHGNIKDTRGEVEFKAYFTDKHGTDQVHHEKSTFLKEDGHWFYLDGIINPTAVDITKKTSRNDPCPCGSGKKAKKCCG